MDSVDKIKKYFLIDTGLIAVLGVVMVYSSSYIYSKEMFGTSTHFFFKQLIFLSIGCAAAFIVSKTKMTFWYKNIYKLNIVAIILLLLTISPLGIVVKGSQRWLTFGTMSMQPGEIIKYTVALSAVLYFNSFEIYSKREKWLYALNFFVPLAILISQPDFGTFTITIILIAFACFVSDFSRKIFYSFFGVGIVGLAALLVAAPYRVKRLLVFLDPWKDPQNSGFQIIQSYLALANGHIWGQGIGNSNEKLFYLPEAYNDFILSVLGEELGFIGIAAIVVLFLIFTFLGFKLALYARSNINKQIIAILVFAISFQAILNMGVILGLLPTKGLNLPFVSSGGSSLISNLVAIGIIMSCVREKSQIDEGEVAFDFNHRNMEYTR
ncbi:MAG: putative lipid II flippase FtsW [Flavobacteriaceae bacterium]|nr:putative lipid II flippase FtsW [Flavobacteriaceae bacterium]